jgi:hypothetical protein
MTTLWITYAWADDSEGDFSYLVQQLRAQGVEATFDRVALIPGRRLWEQIGDKITAGELDGWAYLLTPNSVASQSCREELEYALNRALGAKAEGFPLIGLLHGVSIADLPPALKARLCVDLRSDDWIEKVKAGLEGRSPQIALPVQGPYVSKVHQGYGGDPAATAVEIRPRFGEILHWRIAIPASTAVEAWGFGPAGGMALSSPRNLVVEASTEIDGVPMNVLGSGDRLSPAVSAYVVFSDVAPDFVGFGFANGPYEGPREWEVLRTR